MTVTPVKSAARVRSPGFLIRRLQQHAVSIFIQSLIEFGVTPIQYTILTIVRQSSGIDQGAIAADSVLDASTVTNVLTRLEERGLLTRSADIRDKRRRIVEITASGIALLDEVEPAVEQSRRKLMAPLTDQETVAFFMLIEKLLDGHQESREGGGKPWRRLLVRD